MKIDEVLRSFDSLIKEPPIEANNLVINRYFKEDYRRGL